jgi:hypothetical protein
MNENIRNQITREKNSSAVHGHGGLGWKFGTCLGIYPQMKPASINMQ